MVGWLADRLFSELDLGEEYRAGVICYEVDSSIGVLNRGDRHAHALGDCQESRLTPLLQFFCVS